MMGWFGRIPDYLITLDATYCSKCSDAEFCALVEHELYHIGQEHGVMGEPIFMCSGFPKLFLRGHDIEEFVGIVRRYGVGNPDGKLAEFISAANAAPSLGKHNIAGACGTCLLKAA